MKKLSSHLKLLIDIIIVLASALLLAAVMFRGIVQCSFRYDPPTSSEIAEDPTLLKYK